MDARPANDGLPWTREQLVLAFELYCRIPFQRTKASDSRVKLLASLIGRTPASIARKLGNFGAFDPQLAVQNISGLTHGSKLDKAVWDQFHHDWAGLVVQANDIKNSLKPEVSIDQSLIPPQGPSERLAIVKQRLHQSFFRDAVLSSYNARCCVTGLPIVECLVAGHIIPWSLDESRRADPTNGLCLSATFDRLFDNGFVTVDESLNLCVSKFLRKHIDLAIAELIVARHGQKIIPPARFYPDPKCLRWHRENVFKAS